MKTFYDLESCEFIEERRQINYDKLKEVLKFDWGYTDEYDWIFELVIKTNHSHYGKNKVKLIYRLETFTKLTYDTFFELISIFVHNTKHTNNEIELKGLDYVKANLETLIKEAIERHSKLSERNKPEIKLKERDFFLKMFPMQKHLAIFGNEDYSQNFQLAYENETRLVFFEAEVWLRFYTTLNERLTKENTTQKIDAVKEKKENYKTVKKPTTMVEHQKQLDKIFNLVEIEWRKQKDKNITTLESIYKTAKGKYAKNINKDRSQLNNELKSTGGFEEIKTKINKIYRENL